ncbi:MAG: bifunctional diaminohydroxyphosphoribosylaminopyrimidine deaminase/5-amino-6-(5-phosphoribosylamino)uracil reductase RibD [Saprospiraceae bacterium]|nr:bifunctional diaminohydroxyphosphoribosylaminopyrimidine deaminase/5-amino-6-(5-phosphoribosylamino)uracil reductase RibD [Saprospiraceae bacterium]
MNKWTNIAAETQHNKYIQRTCDLARQGLGRTKINPQVGALVRYKDQILGEGFHNEYGGDHAEVAAFSDIKPCNSQFLPQSILYVTLEPCSHHGKTPPCTSQIIDLHIPEIHVGGEDPNPRVKGIRQLQNAGRKVIIAENQNECGRQIIRSFLIQQKHSRPYIILKWAETLDGFMGVPNRQVQISNKVSRRLVHRWRSEVDAILVGSGTVRIDDPLLTNRFFYGKSPIRVVVEQSRRLDPNSKVFHGDIETILYTASKSTSQPRPPVDCLPLPTDDTALSYMFSDLYKRDLGSVLVEGGKQILESLLQSELWDECRIIRSHHILEQGLPAPRCAGQVIGNYQLQDNEVRIISNPKS